MSVRSERVGGVELLEQAPDHPRRHRQTASASYACAPRGIQPARHMAREDRNRCTQANQGAVSPGRTRGSAPTVLGAGGSGGGSGDDVRAAPLGRNEMTRDRRAAGDRRIVESVIEPEPRVEHERADERARPIAAALRHAGQRRHPLVEAESRVAVNAVPDRQQAGQDRRAGRAA